MQIAELVNSSDDQWLVWCDLNDESHKLHELINASVEVQGSDKDTHKSSSMLDFSNGKIAEANRNGDVWRSYEFKDVMLTSVTGLDD